MAGNPEAKFSIPFESNAPEVGREAAKALEELRSKIQGSQAAIKDMNASFRTLRGSSDDVKKAKDELKAKIDAERNSISANSLQLIKAGTSYEKLTAQVKAAEKAQEAEAKATEAASKAAAADASNLAKEAKAQAAAHGDQASGTERATAALKGFDIVGRRAFRQVDELKQAFGGMSAGTTAAVVGVVALTAVVVTLAKVTYDAAVALGKFIVETGNAQRSMLLTQEGLLGSAQSAKNFAAQVDDVTSRVPLAADEVAKLGDELAGKHLKGQPLVDAMNAIAQTTAAKGQAAGDALKEKLVASLGGGAKEARAAAEKQFGQLNARKMLDLTVQGQHLKDTLASLTRDVNLEPLLKGFQEMLSIFDQSTASGRAIKEIVTLVGNGLSSAVSESAPFVKSFLKQLLIYTLEGAITFLQLRRRIKETFGPDTLGGVDAMNVALGVAKAAVTVMVGSLVATYAVWRAIEAAVGNVTQSFRALFHVGEELKTALTSGWDTVGKTIVTGLVSGITGSSGAVTGAITGLADKVKSGFKSALGIKSPSTVFEEYGQHTAAGFEQGVSGGAGASATNAVTAMAQPPAAAGAGGGAPGAGGGITVNVEINVGGGGAGADAGKQIAQPSVLAALTKAIEDALASHGLVPGRV